MRPSSAVAPNGDRRAFHRVLVARALLRRERQEVDLLVGRGAGLSIEPARQQDAVDQAVELGNVAELGFFAGRCRRFSRFDAEADARQRRAQLVPGVGEQQLVGLDQLLDAGGGAVEAVGEPRDLVIAFDLDAGRKIAGAKLLDAALKPFETAGQARTTG